MLHRRKEEVKENALPASAASETVSFGRNWTKFCQSSQLERVVNCQTALPLDSWHFLGPNASSRKMDSDDSTTVGTAIERRIERYHYHRHCCNDATIKQSSRYRARKKMRQYAASENGVAKQALTINIQSLRGALAEETQSNRMTTASNAVSPALRATVRRQYTATNGNGGDNVGLARRTRCNNKQSTKDRARKRASNRMVTVCWLTHPRCALQFVDDWGRYCIGASMKKNVQYTATATMYDVGTTMEKDRRSSRGALAEDGTVQ